MRAIQFNEFGGPEVLQMVDLECPSPSQNEVLVQIKAIGVNYADTLKRRGKYLKETPLPCVPGIEIAGIITKVGAEVNEYKSGDRIIAFLGSLLDQESTGYAEYTIVKKELVIPIPDDLDFIQAVAIPVQGLTAYHILKTSGNIQPGETVVVHAGAGGVGSLAIQMAKYYGAGKVIATASTNEKLNMAKKDQADILINYQETGWYEKVLAVTNGKGADLILEMVGGEMIDQNLKCLAPFGKMVIYGAASGNRGKIEPVQLLRKSQTVTGFALGNLFLRPELYESSLKEVLKLVSTGSVVVKIGGVFKLEEAPFVHEQLEGRKTMGKLVLVP